MRYYKKSPKSENYFAQSLINQTLTCGLILLSILVLNLFPAMKNFKLKLKNQLAQNISFEELKTVGIEKFNLLMEKLPTDIQDFQIDENLIKQMNADENELNETKKKF
jgi:hypothetical protein